MSVTKANDVFKRLKMRVRLRASFSINFMRLTARDCCALPTWWLWRGGCTRSHSEHGRETPLRRWYFVSRHGRVGRRQVCQAQLTKSSLYNIRTSGRYRGPFCFCHETHTSWQSRGQAAPAEPQRRKPQAPAIINPGKSGSQSFIAGWSSPVARQAHNLKVAGSNPAPATKHSKQTITNPASITQSTPHGPTCGASGVRQGSGAGEAGAGGGLWFRSGGRRKMARRLAGTNW